MKKFILYVTYIFSLGLLFQSCEKDSDELIVIDKTPVSIPTVKQDTIWEDESLLQAPVAGVQLPLLSIEKLINAIKVPITVDSIIAEQGGKIEVGDFTIEIPSGACINKGTNLACKGSVEVNFLLLRTRGELITHDRATIAQGKLLTTGGVIYLALKQNGNEVRLALNKTIKIKYRMSEIEAGMQVFEGKNLNRLQFDWSLGILSNRNTVETWFDSAQQKKGYEVQLDRLGWTSCVKYNESTSLSTKFCVALPDSFTNRNTSVYVLFRDMISVVKLEGAPLLKQFCLPISYKGLPIDKQATVLVIANVNGRSYVAYQEVKVTSNNVIRLQPQSIATEELKKKILNL